jgi:hypothetical protein
VARAEMKLAGLILAVVLAVVAMIVIGLTSSVH